MTYGDAYGKVQKVSYFVNDPPSPNFANQNLMENFKFKI